MLRNTFAAGAAGAGIAAAVVRSNYPPGLHTGQPLAMLGSVFGNGSFWATLLVSAGLIGLFLIAAGGLRSPRFAGATILTTSEPMLWGLSLPLLSVVFDPWFFRTTAPVLVVAGTVLGLLGAAQRMPRTADETGSGADFGPGLAAIIVLAVLVPAFLVLPGPPWFHSISGDEPHYLVIARSLWVDGDVEVGNEYDEGLMSPFWTGPPGGARQTGCQSRRALLDPRTGARRVAGSLVRSRPRFRRDRVHRHGAHRHVAVARRRSRMSVPVDP